MRILRTGLLLVAAVSLAAALSCGKDEQEAQKFNRADEASFHRDMSELSSFQLPNGLTVYMQEERTDHQVAIEVLYRAGYTKDPKGLVQIAHLTEHLSLNCASGKYGVGETLALVKKNHGMLTAEAVANFIHVDYIVDHDRLDEALDIEASRLREIKCDAQTLDAQAKLVVSEFDKTLSDPKGTLTRLALMALAQVAYYNQTHVPISAGVAKLTLDDVKRFHDTYYRPDDMVLVMVGNFQKAEAEALVRKHFESIPGRSTPPTPPVALKRSTRVTWDIPAHVTYFITPGPYQDYKECMILSMFGAYLQQILNSSQDVYGTCQAVYCSNQVYPVGELPFFIFAQPKQGATNQDVVPIIIKYLDQAVASLDDKQVDIIKTGMTSFVTSSMLKLNVPDYPLMHHQVIGQEALNIGMKHVLRDGRALDEFVAEIQSITPDEFRATVQKRADRKVLLQIAVEPRV